jgi:uncharacterized membrane protein YhaH (DUF805 family)
MGLASTLFSFRGRINRKQLWLSLLLYLFATVIVITVGVFIILALKPGISRGEAIDTYYVLFAGWCCLTLIPMLNLYVKRMHDRGRSAWWLVFPFIPSTILALLWPSLSAAGVVPHGSNAWFLVPLFPFFGSVALVGLIPPLIDLAGAKLPVMIAVPIFVLMNLWILVELVFLKGRRDQNAYEFDPLAVGT